VRGANEDRAALPVTGRAEKAVDCTAAQAIEIGPPGACNGQYRHGERIKAAIAEQRKFNAC